MKAIRILLPCLIIGLACGCARTLFPDPHGHVVDVHRAPWRTELAPNVVILPVSVPRLGEIQRQHIVTNQSGTLCAFTISVKHGPPDWQVEYVYFQKPGSDELWVILGLPMEWRPFHDLVWLQDRYLLFDRWSSPHYGMHYVVDALERKLLLAAPFPDQFYLDQQKEGAQPARQDG